ncbi:uncharacterized protein LOC123722152 [Papilio machaon]|uniref:uncharacterized protein LOC123722152 n=1 Tax=Papilio machaon TaxID=76193 RepID=UPI001E66393D|nr:uncharacterized protein LOC123722152 [Papilio machaon]
MVLSFENEFRLSTVALRFNGIHPDSHRDKRWFIQFIFFNSFAIYATIVYVGFDPLISIFVLQICGQLDILSYQLLALNEVTEQNEIIKKLKTINIKLQDLYR